MLLGQAKSEVKFTSNEWRGVEDIDEPAGQE
jgi:hypothetical protein